MASREELYDLVWSKPMTKVAEQFGVSGSYLARVCSTLNVPRPERGYWAKLAVGRAPGRDPLPDARPGDQLVWSKDSELRPSPKPWSAPRSPQARRVQVPLPSMHGLIRGAKVLFEATRPVDDGAYLRPYKRLLLDVTASKACLDKALGFANELFTALESAGHRVVLAPSGEQLERGAIELREVHSKTREQHYPSLWSPSRPTVIYVGTVAIGLAVVEMSEEVLLRYVGGKYVRETDYKAPARRLLDNTWTTTRALPSGRLRLIAYSPYYSVDWSADWQETRATPLSANVNAIVRSIAKAAVDLVEQLQEADRKAEIARIKQLAEQEKWRRQEDRRKVEQSISDSREHLGRIIQRWGEAMNVERFLGGVEARAAGLPPDEQQQVLDRLKIARDFLGSQDPLDFFMSWKSPAERHRPIYPPLPNPESDKGGQQDRSGPEGVGE